MVSAVSETEHIAHTEKFAADLEAEAAGAGCASVAHYLTALTKESWTQAGAERLEREFRNRGYEGAHGVLSHLWSFANDEEARKRAYEAGAASGHPEALYQLALLKEQSEDNRGATDLFQQAAEAGHVEANQTLAWRLESAGDMAGAERWHRNLADRGHTQHLMYLANLRQQENDLTGALSLYQQAAVTGEVDLLPIPAFESWMQTEWRDIFPYGLELDGTPSTSW
ncbi:hypothetical protein ACFYXS_37400 [Streptomyces sp. NPDC002574]|uniref:hypothetical protein n=1 Tax=Streptomyces sp. NPDC002574 TaxID=3364652 RepID=UPI0036C34D15